MSSENGYSAVYRCDGEGCRTQVVMTASSEEDDADLYEVITTVHGDEVKARFRVIPGMSWLIDCGPDDWVLVTAPGEDNRDYCPRCAKKVKHNLDCMCSTCEKKR